MSLPRQTLPLLLYTLPPTLLALLPLTYILHIHPSTPFSPLFPYRNALHEKTGLPPSFLHSRTLLTVNPRSHISNAMGDTRSITLPLKSIQGLSDTEILARFTKGFYGGWTFWAEKCFLSFAAWSVGYRVAGREGSCFPYVPKGMDLPSFPLELSRTSLPPLYSRIAGGNFLLLEHSDVPVSPSSQGEENSKQLATGSFVDFAFGDSRGTFAGCHRFEVLRDEREGNVEVVYVSIACNPINEGHVFSEWLNAFHVLYARVLFWDGVREILR